MLTTYYATINVSNNTYTSKGAMSPYLSGTIITTALNLKLNITTYNTDKLSFLTISSLTPYSTTTQINTLLLNYKL